jgi:hypothetical protein
MWKTKSVGPEDRHQGGAVPALRAYGYDLLALQTLT